MRKLLHQLASRPLYKFRNLPYIEGSIAGTHRFTQSEVRVSPYSSEGQLPYDATRLALMLPTMARSGPMCMQGTLGSLHLDEVFQQVGPSTSLWSRRWRTSSSPSFRRS